MTAWPSHVSRVDLPGSTPRRRDILRASGSKRESASAVQHDYDLINWRRITAGGSAIKEPRSTGETSGVQYQGDVGQEDEEEEPAPCRSSTVSAFRRVASHELVKLKPQRLPLTNAR